jgi:uncharacterized OB-fold protein
MSTNLPTFTPPDLEFNKTFWDGIERGELLVPRCSICGAWQWYPGDMGTCCRGGVYDWQPVSGRGTVHTRTTVQRAFLPGGADDVPFHLVFVDLDDAPGVRFVGNTLDATIDIGTRVHLSFVDTGARRHPVFERLVEA